MPTENPLAAFLNHRIEAVWRTVAGQKEYAISGPDAVTRIYDHEGSLVETRESTIPGMVLVEWMMSKENGSSRTGTCNALDMCKLASERPSLFTNLPI